MALPGFALYIMCYYFYFFRLEGLWGPSSRWLGPPQVPYIGPLLFAWRGCLGSIACVRRPRHQSLMCGCAFGVLVKTEVQYAYCCGTVLRCTATPPSGPATLRAAEPLPDIKAATLCCFTTGLVSLRHGNPIGNPTHLCYSFGGGSRENLGLHSQTGYQP